MRPSDISVAFLMADAGHDPTETAIPFQAFSKAGFSISVITESGRSPECDAKMLTGWTGRLLGAQQSVVDAYHEITQRPEWKTPLTWSSDETSLASFHLLFIPGGHDKPIRQLLDSPRAQQLVADYWPSIKQPSKKCCAAICHGVQLLAHTQINGKSVLHDATTTALVGMMEDSVFWATRLFLGDYYKTYGRGTPNVQDVVKKSLKEPSVQWKASTSMSVPFVVEDEQYNYFSGRFPGDAAALADRVIDRLKQLNDVQQES